MLRGANVYDRHHFMTIDQLFRALGGTSAIAERIGNPVTRQAMDRWRKTNRVPRRFAPAIVALCIADHLPVPPQLVERDP
jgi:hypothetical protein